MNWQRFESMLPPEWQTAVLAGALGGVVRWVTLRSDWREGMGAIVTGAIGAMYLGPLIGPILEPVIGPITPSGGAQGFANFIVGLAGISLFGMITDLFRARRAQMTKEAKKDEG